MVSMVNSPECISAKFVFSLAGILITSNELAFEKNSHGVVLEKKYYKSYLALDKRRNKKIAEKVISFQFFITLRRICDYPQTIVVENISKESSIIIKEYRW